MEYLDHLKTIEFLKVLNDSQMRELAKRLKPQKAAAGHVICRQGDWGDTFYIIHKGRVEVSAQNAEGQMVYRAHLAADDFFGEFSLVTGEPRSATVTALDPTELLTLGKEDLRHVMDTNPQLADHISNILGLRQYQLERRMGISARQAQPAGEEADRVSELQQDLKKRITNFFST